MSKRHKYRNNKFNRSPSVIANKMKEIIIEDNDFEIKLLSVLLDVNETIIKRELNEMNNLAKEELEQLK